MLGIAGIPSSAALLMDGHETTITLGLIIMPTSFVFIFFTYNSKFWVEELTTKGSNNLDLEIEVMKKKIEKEELLAKLEELEKEIKPIN